MYDMYENGWINIHAHIHNCMYDDMYADMYDKVYYMYDDMYDKVDYMCDDMYDAMAIVRGKIARPHICPHSAHMGVCNVVIEM